MPYIPAFKICYVNICYLLCKITRILCKPRTVDILSQVGLAFQMSKRLPWKLSVLDAIAVHLLTTNIHNSVLVLLLLSIMLLLSTVDSEAWLDLRQTSFLRNEIFHRRYDFFKHSETWEYCFFLKSLKIFTTIIPNKPSSAIIRLHKTYQYRISHTGWSRFESPWLTWWLVWHAFEITMCDTIILIKAILGQAGMGCATP